ncbi:Protein of unknown function DUF58 [Gracilibacillus ureilyticus]|uniref:DUF58 domain-containing protein n=1 Tax=Gracilibacillus ureilyticus TaxID=531814 RepID=A0A1H9TWH5_9BACI|nr:DUF58 domain-containing protein [Gracilibacillus ureilyticus]SES01720.1 Protein of unknown function DUF58 [Gracilibacillus ureilyticus]
MSGLLSPVLTKRLANYKITSRKIVRGGHKGERRSIRLGSSLEFSDYRLYSPGDDLRQIDWNTYARSQKFYIKRFLDEQELSVSIYLDCTKSMGITDEKWRRAKQLAASFTFLTLANSDRLSFIPVVSPSGTYPHTKGKAMVNSVIHFIEQASVSNGEERFGQQLSQHSTTGRKGSLNVLISDFLEDPADLFLALKKMQARHQQVLLIQVLLPEEIDPDYTGDLQLVDIETSNQREVSMSQKVISQYKQLFESHTEKIKSFCQKRGMELVLCPVSTNLEETIFSTLMQKGWIRR